MPSPPSCEHRSAVRSSTRKVFTEIFDLVLMGEALPVPRRCVVDHGDADPVGKGEQLILVGVLRADRLGLVYGLDLKCRYQDPETPGRIPPPAGAPRPTR